MSVRVQDFKGDTIAVGTRVMYGEEHEAEVTHISIPDIDDSDEPRVRYGLYVTVKFDDGSTEKLWCNSTTPHSEIYLAEETGREIDETFEEPGDLEVIVKSA